MRLYTRTGDSGDTGLIGGRRVRKDHPRIAAYGDVDELNAAIGWACAGAGDAAWTAKLRRIQNELFVIGSELANPDASAATPAVGDDDVSNLEGWIDDAVGRVPALRNFILPGGAELSARLHVARTVCRRAERGVVALAATEAVDARVVTYLNRLSDLLFALARLANVEGGVADVIWKPAGGA